jgi:D-methionine transport system ATP-binding protein
MIHLIGISKYYSVGGRDIKALDDIHLYVSTGAIFGIIGESGAGKSSLLRSINLLERPSAGQVIVAGKDLTSLSKEEIRKERCLMGMIFQHFNLLGSCHVYDNIALPLRFLGLRREVIDEIITPLIKLTGLVGKERHYPHQLSGGQKQRVAIARALATKPRLLLCDEATSALDRKTTISILDLLKEINERTGLTILLITHELEVIKTICHQVALLDHGRILETSSVVDFFAHPKTDLAKRIVEDSLKMHIPADLKQELASEQIGQKKYPIVRIVFRKTLVREAVISRASRKFMIDISILQSNIEFIGENAVGFLLAELRGEKEAIEGCLAFFRVQLLDYEVMGYVS